jgi:hypothetical protein
MEDRFMVNTELSRFHVAFCLIIPLGIYDANCFGMKELS